MPRTLDNKFIVLHVENTLISHLSGAFALSFSYIAKATLLYHKTKVTQKYAAPALTNIGERSFSYLMLLVRVLDNFL